MGEKFVRQIYYTRSAHKYTVTPAILNIRRQAEALPSIFWHKSGWRAQRALLSDSRGTENQHVEKSKLATDV
jgi:hypothetical protein